MLNHIIELAEHEVPTNLKSLKNSFDVLVTYSTLYLLEEILEEKIEIIGEAPVNIYCNESDIETLKISPK